MKKNFKTRGLILGRKNIGEADRLLTVFTEDYGKIKIIARGARKIKSKLAPHIEPLQLSRLEFVEGKTFYILTGAEREGMKDAFQSLDNYRIISYLYELTDLAFEEREPNKEIFKLLSEISQRKISGDKEDIICRYFELKLLGSLGFGADFLRCKKCGEELTEAPIYIGNFEGLLCKNCQGTGFRIDKDTLKILRFMSAQPLDRVLSVKDINSVNQELEKIITPFLHDILPRHPKSLRL